MPEEQFTAAELIDFIQRGINRGWESPGVSEVSSQELPKPEVADQEIAEQVGMSPLEVVVSTFYSVNYPYGMSGDNRGLTDTLLSGFDGMKSYTKRVLNGHRSPKGVDITAILIEAESLDLKSLASGTELLFERAQRGLGQATPNTTEAVSARALSDRYSRFQEVSAWAAGEGH